MKNCLQLILLSHFLERKYIFFLLPFCYVMFQKLSLYPWNWCQVYHNDGIRWSSHILDYYLHHDLGLFASISLQEILQYVLVGFVFIRIKIFTSFTILEVQYHTNYYEENQSSWDSKDQYYFFDRFFANI